MPKMSNSLNHRVHRERKLKTIVKRSVFSVVNRLFKLCLPLDSFQTLFSHPDGIAMGLKPFGICNRLNGL